METLSKDVNTLLEVQFLRLISENRSCECLGKSFSWWQKFWITMIRRKFIIGVAGEWWAIPRRYVI